ncbi:class I SAM-dependent methyltransferase (plasmid) [Ensifer adhaerens]|uniref:class I SAM-dependent methyltransferase n=1 Tax=Ensifer adhaerens TaxID=106592 RepID=UPI0023A95186|nr:class I SAM-dependent methyltransferase [Ensifer adhaerens]WDZ80927.1 class I SAM-dependent methyltransferase [Ensifer adhaerens]
MSSAYEDVLFDPALNQNWHMQFSERAALLHVLSRLRPEISIEIGTFQCGSLRPIAAASKRVFTFDIDENQHRISPLFPNVTFVTGDSATTLPPIIDQLNEGREDVNFILVDGSHEESGVRSDLLQCARYVPKRRPTMILAHDSANPIVRTGILTVPWNDFPHVHTVDLDFVPGMLYDRPDINGQIWGGLAAVLMMPERREGQVMITTQFEPSRQALLEKSVYRNSNTNT